MTNKIRTIILIAALGILNATGSMHVERCATLTDGGRSTFTYSEEGRGLLVNFQKYFYRYVLKCGHEMWTGPKCCTTNLLQLGFSP